MTRNGLSTRTFDAASPYRLTGDGTFAYGYDAAGRIATRSDGTTYTWNALGQLTSVAGAASESYGYDGNGIRAKKTAGTAPSSTTSRRGTTTRPWPSS